jgi:hypothetical protein
MSAEQASRPTVLRPRTWLFALVLAAAILFVSGAVFSYLQSDWSWTSLGLAGLSILGGAGVLELVTTRIVLSEDALECNSLWSRRRYAAADIASVTWEWGSGVSVKLTSGGWAKLPELGYNSQGLANTLRAWLKRRKAGGE